MQNIPYGRQSISPEDIKAVTEVLHSDFLTQGPYIEAFENAIRTYCGTQYAIAVCNATAALHLAYLALGVGKNDIVWTSPNTFLSTANAAFMCGASVDFIDICPITYNISAECLEEKLKQAAQRNKLPKVVTPVHFAGQSCDMQKIYALSQQYGFYIVEDASHAIGGKYLDKPIGSCQFSDIAVFSFHPVKIITTGEGGALLTNKKHLADKIRQLRTHGMVRDQSEINNKNEGPWYYEMLDLGYNYRITDIQCALGLSQIKRLDQFIQKRHAVKKAYDNLLADIPDLTLPKQDTNNYSALHLYPVKVPAKKRKKVFNHLRDCGIGVAVHYIPVYLQPYYQKMGFANGYCLETERYYQDAISLPLFPDLQAEQIRYICQCIKKGLA